MKKIGIITVVLTLVLATSCNKVRRSPGRAYMPDMAYSRAYETYASTEALKNAGVNYNAMPVAGTIARGDMTWQYPYKNDSAGYANSKNITNPLPALDEKQRTEAARLYLVNCGICHGEKLDGNGPLYKGGDGPFPAKPAALVGDPKYTAMAEGTMFHSITYGFNTMGSYASQLSTEQRWMVIHYIKEKQAATAAPAAATTAPAAKDTTATKTK
ncbi:MAG TPA: cytochrome c [Chitinophagaceae bacterium]|nr:cytochrome c [Chitinophagaceae bacterium]